MFRPPQARLAGATRVVRQWRGRQLAAAFRGWARSSERARVGATRITRLLETAVRRMQQVRGADEFITIINTD